MAIATVARQSRMKSHLRWAVRIIPPRKDKSGQEINLDTILEATENGPPIRRTSSRWRPAICACKFPPEVRVMKFDPQVDWSK